MVDKDDPFGAELRRSLGDVSAGGTTPEQLVELAEKEIAGQMLSVARQAGFESVAQVLKCFDGRLDEAGGDEFRARLNSGTPDSVVAFGELVAKVQAHDEAVDHAEVEERGGFVDHGEFVEASEKAMSARSMGTPDRALELRIANTPDHIVEGRDAGEGL